MQRGAYVGEAGVLGGNSLPVIPVQSEATAYFNRFTTQPTAAYKAALNEFIYKAKRAGAWSLFQDLYLFVADTQADALRNLVSASRDATLGGSLTYIANRGFSGTFDGTNKVSMPFSTSGVTTASATIFAGFVIPNGVGGQIIGVTSTKVGNVRSNGLTAAAGGASSGKTASGTVGAFYVIGGRDNSGVDAFDASGVVNNSGSSTAVEPSPVTTKITSELTRLCAWGVAPTITVAQLTGFMAALNQFMNDVGANP